MYGAAVFVSIPPNFIAEKQILFLQSKFCPLMFLRTGKIEIN